MSDINVVVLAGRLTRKPEIKYTASGTAVVNMDIANNTYKKDAENQQKVNFIPITVWGKQAENVEKYLDKGSQVLVKGRIDWQSWVDKDTQKKRSKIIVIAEAVQFVGSKQERSNAQPEPAQEDQQQNHEPQAMSPDEILPPEGAGPEDWPEGAGDPDDIPF